MLSNRTVDARHTTGDKLRKLPTLPLGRESSLFIISPNPDGRLWQPGFSIQVLSFSSFIQA